MRIAAISDIHGNLYSLMKVLDDIEEQNIDKIICLGDLVGYGPHPNEVISIIKRRNIECLKGNYDASVVDGDYTFIRETNTNSFAFPWVVNELRAANKFYLSELPERFDYDINGKKITFVHGSPNAINEYLYEDKENTLKIIEEFDGDILVCAHTHKPVSKIYNNKHFISTGSVGKPLCGSPDASYCIIDINDIGNVNVKFRTVPYEYKRIVKDCEILKFPSSLIRSFENGQE